jgi:hypothetical protein
MSTKARVNLTAAAGIVAGVSLCLGDASGLAFPALVVLLPLIVGRWWVVAALAGPLVAGVALELTGHMPEDEGGGGLEYDFGFEFFVFYLVLSGLLMLCLVGVRKGFDFLRGAG